MKLRCNQVHSKSEIQRDTRPWRGSWANTAPLTHSGQPGTASTSSFQYAFTLPRHFIKLFSTQRYLSALQSEEQHWPALISDTETDSRLSLSPSLSLSTSSHAAITLSSPALDLPLESSCILASHCPSIGRQLSIYSPLFIYLHCIYF